jgi:sugar (pentulose or hexulose) kinase
VAYVCLESPSDADPAVIRGPYPGGRHYRMVADSCGGNVVNWALGTIGGCTTYDAFFTRAEEAQAGCRGLVFEADLPAGKGCWRNLGLQHSAADLARSVLESLSRRLAELVAHLRVDTSRYRILAAGGGSARPIWIRILSDALQGEIVTVETSPLAGAARMGGRHLGLGRRTS